MSTLPAALRQLKAIPLGLGVFSLIPGTDKVLQAVLRLRGTGGTDSASYCYGVWMKHLSLLQADGKREVPQTLAELGPGDSLGVGLAAVLSGVDRYYALDLVRFSNVETNLRILDELIALFQARAPRPTKGWPDFDEYLDDALFPSCILSDEVLDASLSEVRIAAIRQQITAPGSAASGVVIDYRTPWMDADVIEPASVDVILSHSVLEHVDDLPSTYQALYSWLKPGGLMTHQIDFACHGLSRAWNGYRAFPQRVWRWLKGRRPYLINRQPYSVHAKQLQACGFELIHELKNHRSDGIRRLDLAARWHGISDDDLTCCGAYVQARRP